MGCVLWIVIIIVVAFLITFCTNVIYDLAAAAVPSIAIIMIIVGIIVGFVVAIKNTVRAYKAVYGRKGKKKS